MSVAVAEKGLLWAEIEALAPPGQGMLSTRRSGAAVRLAEVLVSLDAWNEEHFEPPPAIAAVRPHAGAHGLRLSVNVGRIEGGRFVSQVPTKVTAEVDFRLPPGFTVDALARRLDAVTGSCDSVAWRLIKGWDPNWTSLESPVAAAVLGAALAVRGTAPPVVRLPASDAARWRALGVPAVSFGPQPELASGVDDYVYEQDVVDCVAIYVSSAMRFLGAPR